ncbi:MAG: cytochrome c biogenesis protein ResB [Candidatus Omnitrophica bacterium]|nr:cytochrome c biogenesis protein ResB [Candidatus Omnitrophota bacterium]
MEKHPDLRMFKDKASSAPAVPEGGLSFWGRAAVSTFRFLASVKLAVPIILALMVILSAGTIVESLHGPDAAKLLVYDTLWFAAVLVLLGVNVLAAALDRLPWQKKHTGFVITHLGIIVILVGSFMTRYLMIDGQMPVAEGESGAHVTVSEPLVYVFEDGSRRDAILKVNKKPFAWEGREKLKGLEGWPFELYLLRYYPKARVQETLEEAAEGPAAVEITLHNEFVRQQVQLRENDPMRSQADLGPARVTISDKPMEELSPALSEPSLEIVFGNETKTIVIPSGAEFPFRSEIEGTPYRLTVTRILKNAVVHGRELSDDPPAPGENVWKNPAAELTLEGPKLKENHTVFSRFPDFPTAHGMKPSEAGAVLRFRAPHDGEETAARELRIVSAEGDMTYQIRSGSGITSGKIEAGAEIETGWMNLKFRVDRVLKHSRLERSFNPHPNTSEAEDLASAVQVEAAGKGFRRSYWLAAGYREKFEVEGKTVHVVYGQRRIPLGFKVELKDFKIEHYPGTEKPAGFSSDVILKDETRGVVREAHISMNNPLIYNGFRIYQAAYSQNPGEPEISVFAVGRDPGVPIKYAGSVILVSGITIMFAMRRFKNARTPS